jgi:hypothetical protein
LPAQDFEPLQAIDNEMKTTQTMYDVTEEVGFNFQPEQLTREPVGLHVEPTEQLTEDSMAQEVFKLIDSFN